MTRKPKHLDSVSSWLGTLATWAVVIYLFACFIGWLTKRRSTAWIGMMVVLFIPVALGIATILNSLVFLLEDNPWPDLCSAGLFYGETTLGLIGSATLGIWLTFSSTKVK